MIILEIGLVISICLILASITYIRGMLNLSGSITAFILGIIIGVQGGLLWILLLLIFLASSFAATRYKFAYKKGLNVQEGKKGERGAINVVANGIVPTFLAFFSIPLNSSNLLGLGYIPYKISLFLFVTSIACAASDTLASEMGILSRKTYLIINGKKVPPGTNGGISLFGELWAFIGSFYTYFVSFFMIFLFEGWHFSHRWIIFGIFIGFISCQIDSLLGATLERNGYIGKSTVNLIAISIIIIITGGIIWIKGF